ncbi:hypothetical protein Zmor_020630 [Zophobas morio]|uniref:Myb/SANT-like DNA-binding domain-containing protein n=2 Tax=Zophobas morio TaxID=2755281 RepID=A0AA38I509_9CUCU|nr:hypothetical protein Zmor_020630 [Zophobas morio]
MIVEPEANEEENLVEISINSKGEDYSCVVPLHIAQILLNDQERADAFIEDHIENVTNNGNDDDIENVTSNENDDTQLANVWYTKSRPTVKCMTATSKLLELRLRLKDNFNDKKTHKETLWQQIVKEMRETGFNVDAKKCKQKFANLQKTYIKCKDHRRKTGTERINNPPFYFELDAILGEKHKCHPQNLQDTEGEDSSTSIYDDPTPSTSSTTMASTDSQVKEKIGIKNRFKKVKHGIKPKTSNQIYLEFLTKHLQQEAQDRNQHFAAMHTLFTEQTRQRDRMLTILEKMTKKRKREMDSSEDEN